MQNTEITATEAAEAIEASDTVRVWNTGVTTADWDTDARDIDTSTIEIEDDEITAIDTTTGNRVSVEI